MWVSPMLGMSFEEARASYTAPKVEERSPSSDGDKRYFIMETKCNCRICKNGNNCLNGFAFDIVTVNAKGIITHVQEEM